MSLNENIRNIRKAMHLSQAEVAEEIGLHRTTYNQIENGRRKITADNLIDLGKLFKLSLDAIVKGLSQDELNALKEKVGSKKKKKKDK